MNKGFVAWLWFVLIAVISAVVSRADAPFAVTVGTNVVVIAPERSEETTRPDLWATNVVHSQGDIVIYGANLAQDPHGVVTEGTLYMATAAGTSGTNAPVHTSGEVTDSGVTWRAISTDTGIYPTKRTGMDVVLLTDGVIVSLSVDGDAVLNAGKTLLAQGASYHYEGQGKVTAISDSTNAVLSVQEEIK